MRKVLLAAAALLALAGPAAAVDGYVQEPQEGEVYYVALVSWNCWPGLNEGTKNTSDFGPFVTHDVAKKWGEGAYHTIDTRNGLVPIGSQSYPRVYFETDKKSWLHPTELDQLLARFAEYCLTRDTQN